MLRPTNKHDSNTRSVVLPMLNLHAYLERIAYSGATVPSAETLCALHRAHMFSVPFENLDIHLGRAILCDEARILHKVVHEHRGGFCYELNGAFAALLRTLGFEVTLLSARVARADGGSGPEFDHLTLRVDFPSLGASGHSNTATHPASPLLADAWLADVGFGDSFVEPLHLQPNLEQAQFGRVYRLVDANGALHLEVLTDGRWSRQYSFTLQPRQLSDFAGMCHYHQTSPESHFTRRRICTRATPQGRISLSDLKLIETREGRKEERELSGEEEWRALLREQFQIDLTAAYAEGISFFP